MTSRNDIDREARRLAKEGYGHEDIYVRLRHLGVTPWHARLIVFGSGSARNMQIAQARRERVEAS